MDNNQENLEPKDVVTKETLEIKNFGPIKNISLELKKTSVFIGPQGSGKSTIAKLISIFRDYKFLYNENETNYNKFFDNYNIGNYFIKSSNPIERDSETYIEYKNPQYKIVYRKGEFSIEKKIFYQSVNKSENERIETLLNQFEKNKQSNEKQRESLKQIILGEKTLFSEVFLKLITDSVYVPAERILISLLSESLFGIIAGQISLPKCISDFGSLFEKARKTKNEISIDFLKISYKYEQNINKVYYEKKKYVKLSESASGYQSIIPLLMVLEYLSKENVSRISFVIEEPELNLFPTSQKELIDILSKKCLEGKNNLVITTHSPYILSSFSNLLFAFQVSKKHPKKDKEVNKIVNKDSWINPDHFTAYFISSDGATQIFDNETKLIDENELDQVSDFIADEFNQLMDIYKT